ncbi:protein sprint isoform X6 [Drosophila subobscura]|uniref:protein sprint isoform X6 n=1 Tax=Drosophila subobscura TaxID=7241 RepID=UPI00155A0595|nr:protein sprint isoform X6 [Drosophila subobscura]
MSWFRRSSRVQTASQSESDRDQDKDKDADKDSNGKPDMSKSLSSLDEQRIERLEPEEFFHDPDHVRHYKEEAMFLSIMAEWEIIEHPPQGNYFSADFEEELLLQRTQPQTQSQPDLITTLTCSGSTFDSTEVMEKPPKRRRKRKFLELLFVDNIQTGIALPSGGMGQEQPSPSSVLCKKSKYASSSLSSIGSVMLHTTATTTMATCPQQVLKDCRINRTQLKTEALAGSIMGAIGKCPNPTAEANMASTQQILGSFESNTDSCHPGELNTCDHYDIKQFFHLDERGNILLNMTHIMEFRACGLALQGQSRRLYRRYRRDCECADEDYCRKRGCCYLLRRLLRLLCELIVGHPRNKMNIQSSGPGDSLRAYTLQLALDPSSTFARNIENFISCTKESREAAPQVVMRNMRQFMSGMKNYLVKHGEGKFHAELESARGRLKADEFLNLDAMLETVMHQLVVLPLREHLYGIFVDYYTRSEDIQLLAQNVRYACEREAADFGIRPTVTPPSQTALRLIANLLWRLQEAELPLDKLELFLCVISTVFDATGCPRGQQLGADDFLPVLVYVVAKCGFVGAEIEAEFMWGLLQPTLLNGEPGYYLTALCSAVQVLKTFMASESESGSGSLDWRSSCLPACSSVLRVIIPDECNGSLQTRTLPVRPHTTTREVCRIIAHKARITNPQDYALFKLVDGEETLLSDAECPQDARLAAKGKHCMLAYKRIDAKIAWPTTQPAGH